LCLINVITKLTQDVEPCSAWLLGFMVAIRIDDTGDDGCSGCTQLLLASGMREVRVPYLPSAKGESEVGCLF
jgi:hypothetical protein